jgi:hypothetical protein
LLTPPATAVRVAVWEEVTAETVAVKVALLALAATLTMEGMATAGLLLESATLIPPLGAAPLRFREQLSEPAVV